jgi:RNA polymerase sigma-70 factor (ECF subfamily)
LTTIGVGEIDTVTTMSVESTDLAARFGMDILPHVDRLHQVAYRYTRQLSDAEDLVQETLTKAWVGFSSFVPGSNARAWLFRIMANTAMSNFRKTRCRPRENLTDGFTDDQLRSEARHTSRGLPSAEDQALALIGDETITEALAALPAILREVIYYADVEGLRYREIAAIMGVPEGTVMSRVHRSRDRLRALLSATPDVHAAARDFNRQLVQPA